MKILFIGNYRNSSGWSIAAKNYIRSLISIENFDVTLRPIYLCNSPLSILESDLALLEKKVSKSYDCVIQKVLPYMVYSDKRCGQNILLTTIETSNLKYTGWKNHLSIMDTILTPDSYGKNELENITDTPVFNVGEAIDVESIKNNQEIYPLDIKSKFIFYYIGEYNDRKNLHVIIDAYLSEFTKLDDVLLILKVGGGTQSLQKIYEYAEISKKQRLRKFMNNEMYPTIQIIAKPIENIISFHRACHCYINASHGEAFSIPSAEALCVGNPVICTAGIGTCDYVNNNNGWIISPSISDNISCKTPSIVDYNTCNEIWKNIRLYDLKTIMRQAYEDKQLYKEKSRTASETSSLFLYKKVGSRIQKAIEHWK